MSDRSRTVGGSVFYKVGPETAKRHCPYPFVVERGTAYHHVLLSGDGECDDEKINSKIC